MATPNEQTLSKKTRRILFHLVVGLLVATLPLWISRFGLALSTQIMYLGILVMSFTFMASHGGLLSLAQVSFFGIAGYTLGILTVKAGMPLPYPYLLGILMAAVGAAILGLITIRVTAIPFLMMTLAFGEITYGIQSITADTQFIRDRICTFDNFPPTGIKTRREYYMIVGKGILI